MSLAAGDQLGAYRIVAPLGAGGMGEVFRATDTRLGRDVALKRLPDGFASDPERLARFEREAKLLASLQHPNIATLFGLEDVGGERLLAMELVPGQDLKALLALGPLPIDEAIAVARQVAEALEEAHEHGIVHRDLKPANVTLTPDGKVKVLDFGLAKAWSGESGDAISGSAALSQSPTLAHTGTAAGLILGTAAYMSPEQARGRSVDKRSDIWSFGVLLYEMLTGRRLFEGETVSDVLAAVLKTEPDWAGLPAATPPSVRRLLERCLERDPKRRLRDIGEARLALESAQSAGAADAEDPEAQPRRGPTPVVVGVAALAAAALGAVAGRAILPEPTKPPRLVRLVHPLPAGHNTTGQGHALALAPDGTRFVYASDQRLYLRALDSLGAVAIPGTEEGTQPFFSPDGEWLGFSASGSLKKVHLRGGGVSTIAPIAGSASWARDGTILVGAGFAGVLRVPAGGGEVVTLVAPQAGFSFGYPQFLPDGRSFLYARMRVGANASAESFVRSLERDDSSSVLPGGIAHYAPSGHLVFASGSGLNAVAFNLRARRTSGSPVVVEELRDLNVYDEYFFALSDQGTLAYVPDLSDSTPTRLVAVSAAGAATALATEPRFFSDPRLSPDNTLVAVHLQGNQNDVWVADQARGSLMRLSSDPGEDETPVWSRDGRFVVWTASRAEVARGIYRRAADASGGEELLWTTDAHLHVNDWSPDGTMLLLEIQDPQTGPDLYRLRLGSTPSAEPFVKTRFREHSGRIAPGGRHVVYVSDESGRDEVYLQSFPEPGGKLQVSTSGGTQPLWSRDGRSIFFRGGGSVQAVAFTPGPTTAVSVPSPLFADRFENPQSGSHTGYDVFADGRFLMIEPADKDHAGRRTEVVVVLDFLANVAAKVRGDQP